MECDPLEDIENGDVIVTSFTPGSEADYICDEGYVLIGQETRVCEHVDRTSTRGEWSGEEPSCQRKFRVPSHLFIMEGSLCSSSV